MTKQTPTMILAILGIADKPLTADERQRFLKACAEVVEVKVAAPKPRHRKGNVIYLIRPEKKP